MQALSPKTNCQHPSAKRKLHDITKNDSLTKRLKASDKETPQFSFSGTWEELKYNPAGEANAKITTDMGGARVILD